MIIETFRQALQNVWTEHKLGKKPALLPLNRQAFDLGLKLGREQR